MKENGYFFTSSFLFLSQKLDYAINGFVGLRNCLTFLSSLDIDFFLLASGDQSLQLLGSSAEFLFSICLHFFYMVNSKAPLPRNQHLPFPLIGLFLI